MRLFRGLSAAASLKQEVGMTREERLEAALPRPQCRGLIEASRGADLAGRKHLFRGLSAAASLKHSY